MIKLAQIKNSFPKARLSDKIAILALVVSILLPISLHFYQNIREKIDVKATVLSYWPDYHGSKFVVDIVFTNNGNRSCSVANIGLESENTYDKNSPIPKSFPYIACVNQEPFSINPKELVTKQFRMGNGLLNPDRKDKNEIRPIDIKYRLLIGIVDSHGDYHEIKVPVMSQGTTNNKYTNEIDRLPKSIRLLPSSIVKTSFHFPQPQRETK